LEAEISERLFPGKTSRPKVSEIGKMLEEYQEADDTFRELWLLFLVSTVVAPTTDVKMSNKMLSNAGNRTSQTTLFYVLFGS
jgi:hypothetical protein